MDRGIIRLPKWGSGFFSNYFCVISMLYDVEELGLYPYVDFRNTAFVEGYNPYFDESPPETSENPWDWWFVQNNLDEISSHVLIKYSNNRFNVNRKIFGVNELEYARYLRDKYIQIKEHILNKASDYYDENLRGKTVLGVMARGTEMNRIHPEYGNQSIKDYISQTKKVLAKHQNIDAIFLVTEDISYVNEFKKHFPDVYYLKDVFRRTNEPLDYTIKYPLWPCIKNYRDNHCKLLGEEMLIQALLLGKCDYLIAKVCGTASAAVFLSESLRMVYYVDTPVLTNPNLTYRQRAGLLFNKLFKGI